MSVNRLLLFALTLAILGAGPAAARTLQEVISNGTLRVGVTLAEPWAMRDEESGEYSGFEIDVARKLADDMELELEFVRYDYGELIRALESGQVDILVAGLTITPERALHVNFSNPYAAGGVGMATNSETTAAVERLEELDAPEFTIAVMADSVAEDLAERLLPRARLEPYRDEAEAIDALVAGEVDVYLEQEPIPTFLALEYPQQIDVPVNQPLLPTPSAFAVMKGDPDFLAFLNAWIVAREADTWLPTTYQYWFRSLAWRD